jgi:hypothetical protein
VGTERWSVTRTRNMSSYPGYAEGFEQDSVAPYKMLNAGA